MPATAEVLDIFRTQPWWRQDVFGKFVAHLAAGAEPPAEQQQQPQEKDQENEQRDEPEEASRRALCK